MSSIPVEIHTGTPAPQPARGAIAPGRIGIWLFIASDVMLFVGILGSYVLFRAADPSLFSGQSIALNKIVGGICTLVLIVSSFTMAMCVQAARRQKRRRTISCLSLTLVLGCIFLGLQTAQYSNKFSHYTVIARNPDGRAYVYDGHAKQSSGAIQLTGFAAPMPANNTWDIHLLTAQQAKSAAERAGASSLPASYRIPTSSIIQEINDGPWKNLFFACYFVLTGMHALHLLGGIIVLSLLLILAVRGRVPAAAIEYTGAYWHFVTAVWIFLYVLLYLL